MQRPAMIVLATVCVAGSSIAHANVPSPTPVELISHSHATPASSGVSTPTAILTLPDAPTRTKVGLWPAPQSSQAVGALLLASGQWVPVRDGVWLWIAYDQPAKYAAHPSGLVYQYTYYPALGWRSAVAPDAPGSAPLARSPFADLGALGGTPALGLGAARPHSRPFLRVRRPAQPERPDLSADPGSAKFRPARAEPGHAK